LVRKNSQPLRRFADGGGDDFARLFGGSVLALRIFAALEAVGVRFGEQYPDQDARLKSYWTFMHERSPSHQYFYEASRIAVAYLEQMDDVVARLKGGTIEIHKLDDQRILATMIGMLLELSRQAVERKQLVDYITQLAADTPKDILQNALQALCHYYLGSLPKDAFFDPWTNREMGRALRTALPDLSADVRKMCQ
jgi:hypothetical protein